MAQRQRAKPDEQTFRLQIPALTGQQSQQMTSVAIPHGFELRLGSEVKIRITSEITSTSQMINLTFDLGRLMGQAPVRRKD
ncbi:MAG: hypothetical protein U0R44_02910 [Candidatus Micrarchaeia archaeon]